MRVLLLAIALAIPVCVCAVSGYYGTVYPYYKMVEEAVTSDPKNLYLLRQGFLPVVTAQPWLIDDVHTLLIKTHIIYRNSYGDDDSMSVSFNKTWWFRWTDSSLLSLISPDELLAFDPVGFTVLYSAIMGSENPKSLEMVIQIHDTQPGIIDQAKITDKLLKAVTLFFSWGKAYARSNGVPTLWDEKDQGYIGVWYTYYAIGSPFTIQDNYRKEFNKTHLGFLLTFIFLNLLLPATLLRHAYKWSTNKRLNKIYRGPNLSLAIMLFWVAGFITTLFNIAYVIGAIALHFSDHQSPVYCFIHKKHECSVPKSEYENTFTMEALISKAAVFPVAIATELIAAVLVARKLEIPAPPLFASRICRRCRMAGCFKTFAVWQFFIFAQIVIGLMGIPLTITLVISPARTTLHLISLIFFFLSLAFFVRYIFSIDYNKPSCKLKNIFVQCISLLEAVLSMAVLSGVIAEYYILIHEGLSMKGVKGYVVSLLPTILLSLFVWALKRKLMKKSSHSEPPEYFHSASELQPLLGHSEAVLLT